MAKKVDSIDAQTLKELQRLGKVFQRKEKQMLDASKDLQNLVKKIMDDQQMWDSMEDVLDMIYLIPKGYAQFTLWERYYELKKTARGERLKSRSLFFYFLVSRRNIVLVVNIGGMII